MPLAAYQYRPATPPAVAEVPGLTAINYGRRPSDASQWSLESFPDSIDVHALTPLDRSPIRHHGQKLLPKLRTQDNSLEPVPRSVARHSAHRRAVSTGYEAPAPEAFVGGPWRTTSSPPERIPTPDPESAISACFSNGGDFSIDSPVTLIPGANRRLGGNHLRSISSGTVDHATLLRYAYPTARTQPSYLSNWTDSFGDSFSESTSTLVTPTPFGNSHNHTLSQPDHYDLPLDLQFSEPTDAVMTLNSYLRSPNPPIDLCRQVGNTLGRGMHQHYWWDIRNLRQWTSFSVSGINSIDGFESLLNIPVKSTAFPDPSSLLLQSHRLPETESSLTEAIRVFYAAKVTAALKIAMPPKHALAMRACPDRDGPAFISTHASDTERTLSGTGQRGRVVGIVRSHQNWNSSMRTGNGNDKVHYLEGLACLHRHMREHQTRYGFIMTETELVCARAGTDEVPYFGLLELSRPIETRINGEMSTPELSSGGGGSSSSCCEAASTLNGNSAGSAFGGSASSTAGSSFGEAPSQEQELTVCTALWYLHMLAKEEPLPSQPAWRMMVGPPSAMRRQHTLPDKDKWIPLPQKRETRDSKTVRGWVWPSDPWNKKREGGRIGGRR